MDARARPIALACVLLALCGCRSPTGSFRAERVPKGTGWQCWMGRCDRVCLGLPGPPDSTGFTPEPTCSQPKSAFCVTYDMGTTHQLDREPHWECFDTRQSCEGNQRRYVEEARQRRDYASVSPCTELP